MLTTGQIKKALLACTVAGLLVATALTSGASGASASPAPAAVPAATSPTAPCDAISPYAIPCTALGKTFDAVSNECRRVGIPDLLCVLPLAHKVTQAARDAYMTSW